MNSNFKLGIVAKYQKDGWVIVKNFFKKKDIKTIKSQILKQKQKNSK